MTLFCKPVNSKKRFAPHRKLDNNYSFTLFDCASSIPENQLTQIIQPEDIFFNKEYLAKHTELLEIDYYGYLPIKACTEKLKEVKLRYL